MRHLIVCCDGTWNTPDQEDNGIPSPTNVVKLMNSLAETTSAGIEQLAYYHPGVGTKGGLDKIRGGAYGVGVSNQIKSAYQWLGVNYQPGDVVYLFGFSRGAFIARSLGGFLGRGLLDLRGESESDSWKRVEIAYAEGYRKHKKAEEDEKDWAKGWAIFHNGEAFPIRFLGVWDTVGALGVPDDLPILDLLDKPQNWKFHDTELGAHVATARHAMAIDEMRASFTVTPWTAIAAGTDARQIWFPGVHGDVGGSYSDHGLGDGALKWMMDEARECGLEFRETAFQFIHPDPMAVIHDSYKGAFKHLRSRPRNVPALDSCNKNLFHESAFVRQKNSPIAHPPYRRTNRLPIGKSSSWMEIFADQKWNDTGLYLEKDGKYRFQSEGMWQDGADACDWRGMQNESITFGTVVRAISSGVGMVENAYRHFHPEKVTDFLFTKRVEHLPWFAGIGAIANDGDPKAAMPNDGTPPEHQCFTMSDHGVEGVALEAKASGYLYCFANDVWGLYHNNHGSIRIKVTRLA